MQLSHIHIISDCKVKTSREFMFKQLKKLHNMGETFVSVARFFPDISDYKHQRLSHISSFLFTLLVVWRRVDYGLNRCSCN